MIIKRAKDPLKTDRTSYVTGRVLTPYIFPIADWFNNKNPAAVPAIAKKYGSLNALLISIFNCVLNWYQVVKESKTGDIDPWETLGSRTLSLLGWEYFFLLKPNNLYSLEKLNFFIPNKKKAAPIKSQISLFKTSHFPKGISKVSLSLGVQYLTRSLTASPPNGSNNVAIHLVSMSLVKFDEVR